MNEFETRILAQFNSADLSQTLDGGLWYANYRDQIDAIRGNRSITTACAVIAVSSINTNPRQGLNWAAKFMRGVTGGHLPIVCTRANQILASDTDNFDVLRDIACPSTSPSKKVRNFGCNVLNGGSDCNHSVPCVTIDRWANRIATGDMKAGVPTGKNYDAIANAYRNVATYLGMPVAILQAITWVTVAE